MGSAWGFGEGSTTRNFIVSPNLVRAIKSRRLKWIADVGMRAHKGSFKISRGKPTGK